jgi:hypothetical protein
MLSISLSLRQIKPKGPILLTFPIFPQKNPSHQYVLMLGA